MYTKSCLLSPHSLAQEPKRSPQPNLPSISTHQAQHCRSLSSRLALLTEPRLPRFHLLVFLLFSRPPSSSAGTPTHPHHFECHPFFSMSPSLTPLCWESCDLSQLRLLLSSVYCQPPALEGVQSGYHGKSLAVCMSCALLSGQLQAPYGQRAGVVFLFYVPMVFSHMGPWVCSHTH